MANKNNHLIDAYRQLRQQRESYVLATIIETAGSTYQKAGARMLISKTGKLTGLLGGGCFEADLIEHSLSIFETGQAKTVFYDMRSPDDAVWGLGLGCNGAVKVFLQLLKVEDDFSPLNYLIDAALENKSGVLVTVYESAHPDFTPGSSLFLPASAVANGQLLSSAPYPFITAALQTLLQQKPRSETHWLGEQTIQAFYDLVQPPLCLLVLGAGIDAMPVVQCAKSLGWQVTVADHRPAHINRQRFPQADRQLHALPEELGRQVDLNQFQALVLMTHNFDSDQRFLKAVAGSSIPYIGLLGPGHRKDRLLQTLGAEAERLGERVYGPVGLDIGAETPEEIALSIMAGIHAQLKSRSGRHLSQKTEAETHECLPQ